MWAFSSGGERALLSACGVEASRCSSFSGCGAPALGTWTSAAADVGSVASARGL